MILSLPVLIHQQHEGVKPMPFYNVSLVFHPDLVRSGENVERIMGRLAYAVRERIQKYVSRPRQDELAMLAFSPEISGKRLTLTLQLRQRRAAVTVYVVLFATRVGRVAFATALPKVWFLVDDKAELADRAQEVLTAYFREQEDEERGLRPESIELKGRAWLTELELEINPNWRAPKEEPLSGKLGFSEAGEVADGFMELCKTGIRLDSLYPDELERALYRDAEIERLQGALRRRHGRAVIVVGPRGCGKTNLVHELVYRDVSTRKSKNSIKANTWLLSPQRLISGMSFAGQWENRCNAILKEAEKNRHVLYFNDMVGLFRAGQHSKSSLSVAQLLKTAMEKGRLRVIGECTPESFGKVQELDRGFADMFEVIRLNEPAGEETLRILIDYQRQLEGRFKCRFALDVLGTVVELQRRYAPELSFPGKGTSFLRHLAVKYAGVEVKRDDVIREFESKHGFTATFLDNRNALQRSDVVGALEKQVVGQPGAVNAAADAICIAKARLNDPMRPLATMLFLGPTGVGKTECAKAIAAYLFGSAERLVRFDMNEFADSLAVSRLVGTFQQPEGLLTRAIRNQPFSVLLLDEIEKAYPDVFNLLLQVLGEGRLTDALGSTVSFTNCFIVMTSNLGARDAGRGLGFVEEPGAQATRFTGAARQFFRPEFFNRIGRIVPFNTLQPGDLAGIAAHALKEVISREGLARRRATLTLDPELISHLVDTGFRPDQGARALKRNIEKAVAQRVSEDLCSMPPRAPLIMELSRSSSGAGLDVRTQALVPASQRANQVFNYARKPLYRALPVIRRLFDQLEARVEANAPRASVSSTSLDPETIHHYRLRDRMGLLRRRLDGLAERASGRKGTSAPAKPQAKPDWHVLGQLPDDLLARDLRPFLKEAYNNAPQELLEDPMLSELIQELAVLNAFADARQPCRVLFHLEHPLTGLIDAIGSCGRRYLDMDVSQVHADLPGECFCCSGPGVAGFLRLFEGCHMSLCPHDGLAVMRATVREIAADADPLLEASALIAKDRPVSDAVLPVIAIWDSSGVSIDLRSRLMCRGFPGAQALLRLMAAQLPVGSPAKKEAR